MDAALNVEQARFNMIEQQIRPWDVLDSSVLSLLAMVRREAFVPPTARSLAFSDLEIPLGDGEVMLTPKVEARMLQEAAPHKHERVLEIGTGSGYTAALLAHRAQSVITLERNERLAEMAERNLQANGVVNAQVRHLDGAQGLPGEAPFDLIVLSGSVDHVGAGLVGQLKPGGRLIAIVGQQPVMRCVRMRPSQGGQPVIEVLFDTVAPRLHGFAEPSRFAF